MSVGKVKASKVKVFAPPENTSGLDGRFHVYVYDVLHRVFMPGKAFDTVERAVSFQRHEQERIYAEQEAEPELFDYPFISSDPELIERVERNPDYKAQLIKDLGGEVRSRSRHR
ncbi:MAG TPA: hypothetical protein VEY91_09965 [Candidatus Limnocylindria bacterium]|nr:hypothetical protein [Candidatus Limnocylindria bacterium]